MKIYGETYGCTMNQGDTELMLGSLEDNGHTIVDEPEEADVTLLNTCAVTRTTLNKVVYRMKELKKEDQRIVVAGCLPLIDPEKIEDMGEFEAVISCLTTDEVSEVIERIAKGETGIKKVEGVSEKTQGNRYRREGISCPLPIAEGCVSDCSYCCVKFARGKLRSFDPDDIVSEVKDEVEAGRREIFITAQDTGVYGLDIGTDLPSLVERITSLEDRFRIRIGMMNPDRGKEMLPDLIEAYESEKVYKFIHLPVQSGNNEILKRMRRGYTVEDFRKMTNSLKEKYPDLYLSTDIIAGFPGETTEDFQDSIQLMKEVKPDKINITRFTPMPGTDAKKMKQVDSEEKKRRSKRLTELYQELAYEKNKKFVGDERNGLVVKKGKKGGYMVRLQSYRPVIVEDASPGEFVRVKITGAKLTYLDGKVLEVEK